MDSLAEAITTTTDASGWSSLRRRLENASREVAAEVGKSLAKAVTHELLALVKGRLGEHVGEGIAAFVKGLRTDPLQEIKHDVRRRSDGNVVKVLVRLCDEVAAALELQLIISLDEVQRLTDADQRILASLTDNPPRKARFVISWSLADHAANVGLSRLRTTRSREIRIGGLTRDDVATWIAEAELDDSIIDQFMLLSSGYPLIIEGLINQLQNDGSIAEYTPPTAFTQSVVDSIARLDGAADSVARRLSAFVSPPPEDSITEYLSMSPIDWGRIRDALQREHLLTVERDGRLWFHEQRRKFLWNKVLDQRQREDVGQEAFSTLVDQFMKEGQFYTRLLVPISQLARFARQSQADSPALRRVVELSETELAVMASTIELELSTDDGKRWTQPEQALIYANTAFGCDRGDAIDALPGLIEKGLIRSLPISIQGNHDTDIVAEVGVDFASTSTLVLHGRVQSVLGRAVTPGVTASVIRDHFDDLRLQATYVVSSVGSAEPIDLIARVEGFPYRTPPSLGPANPMLGVWVDYGTETISLAATFRNNSDLQRAREIAENVTGTSYGQRIRVAKLFTDPSRALPSWRFVRAVHFATGRQVAKRPDGEIYMINSRPAPLREYAARQVLIRKILQTSCDELERAVYALDSKPGMAFAERDNTFHLVELRGSGRVFEVSNDLTSLVFGQPYRFARLEQVLALRPSETVTQFHSVGGAVRRQRRDPVVSRLNNLLRTARMFNAHQAPVEIPLDDTLERYISTAHVREMELAKILSEQITIGEHRGTRPEQSLRVAVFNGMDRRIPPLVAFTYMPGNAEDVIVKILDGAHPADADELFRRAFGPSVPPSGLQAGTAKEALAYLAGYQMDDVQISRTIV
ncbi:hypothetical protein [Rhodococcoides fascians]|uniref:hypothetical protein n=2 Tax=Nocardiaceae TaxID=85025 RepID=UPI0024B93212|nr:hypothetical protein [Rhodococcus fascians]MDJ0408913.1 hypothetical protein [Rhodococcus fascians]